MEASAAMSKFCNTAVPFWKSPSDVTWKQLHGLLECARSTIIPNEVLEHLEPVVIWILPGAADFGASPDTFCV